MWYLITLMMIGGLSPQAGPLTATEFETLDRCELAKKSLLAEADKKSWRMDNHVVFCTQK